MRKSRSQAIRRLSPHSARLEATKRLLGAARREERPQGNIDHEGARTGYDIRGRGLPPIKRGGTTTKNPAKAKEPRTMPRNNCWVAAAPARRCVKTANTVANTGNGDNRPLTFGPSTAAVPVRRSTSAVATAILRGTSQRGAGGALSALRLIGRYRNASRLTATVPPAVGPSARGTRLKSAAPARYAAIPAAVARVQERVRERRAYTTQKQATPTRPASVPTAARAANPGPCSRARNTETGPDVSGSPASQPPTAGPHRRPASVAAAMRSGVSTTFARRRVTRSPDNIRSTSILALRTCAITGVERHPNSP